MLISGHLKVHSESFYRKIIVFNKNTTDQEKNSIVESNGGIVISNLNIINCVLAQFPKGDVQFKGDKVFKVENDEIVKIDPAYESINTTNINKRDFTNCKTIFCKIKVFRCSLSGK